MFSPDEPKPQGSSRHTTTSSQGGRTDAVSYALLTTNRPVPPSDDKLAIQRAPLARRLPHRQVWEGTRGEPYCRPALRRLGRASKRTCSARVFRCLRAVAFGLFFVRVVRRCSIDSKPGLPWGCGETFIHDKRGQHHICCRAAHTTRWARGQPGFLIGLCPGNYLISAQGSSWHCRAALLIVRDFDHDTAELPTGSLPGEIYM